MANYTIAENITALLVEKTESCFGSFAIKKMLKADQVALFGRYMGKGTLVINGETETVTHVRSVGFGMDTEWTAQIRFDGTLVFDNTRCAG